MKTLLIVEDEKIIRHGIRTIVHRSGINVSEIIECKNGQDAMAYLSDHGADIMITDIRMPVMDGLELVEQVQKLAVPPLVVAISGYDDFTYAVDMLRKGVRDYLLKPIDKDKLITILKQLNLELELRDRHEKNRHTAGRHLLRTLMQGDQPKEDEMQAISEQFHDVLFTSDYIAACAPPLSNAIDALPNPIILQDVQGHTVFLEDARYQSRLEEDRFDNECIGVSSVKSGLMSLHDAYEEAAAARGAAFTCRKRVFFEKKYSLLEKEKEDAQIHYQREELFDLIDQIVHMVGVFNVKHAKQVLGTVVLNAQNGKMAPKTFSYSMKRLVGELASLLPEQQQHETETIQSLKNIWHYPNIYEYYEALSAWMHQLGEVLRLIYEGEHKEKILRAALYMQENFMLNLDMAMVSNFISMNYTQFSYLFKQYMNCNFLDYLKTLRLEESRRLLRETNLLISEVSRRSGFKNEKHFFKVFKQSYGVSPNEYRRVFKLKNTSRTD